MDESKKVTYKSFQEFWPFYLSQHQNPLNRKLHVAGTFIGLTVGFILIFKKQFLVGLIAGLTLGYGFAWTGHFVFEKNRSATFKYPFYSLRGDFKLLFYTLLNKEF
jgi:hypothetical protein